MSTPATHPCDACGGTGGNNWVVRYWRDQQPLFEIAFHDEATARRESEYLDRAGWGRVTCSPIESPDPCPVCLGAGRFPDRMPAKDAVADAETLRLCGLIEAGIFGIGTAAAMIRQPHAGIWDGLELLDAPQLLVAAQARLNARAAFRAVPGLRED